MIKIPKLSMLSQFHHINLIFDVIYDNVDKKRIINESIILPIVIIILKSMELRSIEVYMMSCSNNVDESLLSFYSIG